MYCQRCNILFIFNSENVNHSCSLNMLEPYSVQVIVGIICGDFSRFIDSMTKTDCDATWDYIITRNANTFKKREH